jgi:hypothetical protein
VVVLAGGVLGDAVKQLLPELKHAAMVKDFPDHIKQAGLAAKLGKKCPELRIVSTKVR